MWNKVLVIVNEETHEMRVMCVNPNTLVHAEKFSNTPTSFFLPF